MALHTIMGDAERFSHSDLVINENINMEFREEIRKNKF
jgi:hypothetical protein